LELFLAFDDASPPDDAPRASLGFCEAPRRRRSSAPFFFSELSALSAPPGFELATSVLPACTRATRPMVPSTSRTFNPCGCVAELVRNSRTTPRVVDPLRWSSLRMTSTSDPIWMSARRRGSGSMPGRTNANLSWPSLDDDDDDDARTTHGCRDEDAHAAVRTTRVCRVRTCLDACTRVVSPGRCRGEGAKAACAIADVTISRQLWICHALVLDLYYLCAVIYL